MQEIWKDVKDFEGRYEVSNLGRIRHIKGRIRTPWLVDGYPTLAFGKPVYDSSGTRTGRELKSFRVHRIVAEAFIPNPENFPIVRHKDNCRTNARVDNLEWGTKKDNMQDLSTFYKEAIQFKAEIDRLKGILKSLGYEE